jgi:hypothetical protein
MLTKAKLTTTEGYVKYRTQAKARKVARKLDLQGTHSHQMDGKTIYMPSNSHSALNAELRKRGLPATMVPVSGAGGMAGGDMSSMSDDMSSDTGRMEMGMNGAGGMMPDPTDSDPAFNQQRMMDAGITPADEMSMDDGMFDMDMQEGERPEDPLNMGKMGMDQAMFGERTPLGERELTGDEDDDGEMEIY